MGVPRDISTLHILNAAEGVFGARGYAGASMAAIAQAADLPKANIHYYFHTKDLLYKAVLENTLTDWLADATSWITPERTPESALRGYVRAKLAFSRERPATSRLFAYEMLEGASHIRVYLETTLRDHVRGIGTTLAHWADRGAMARVQPAHFMFCLWAMTQAYADMLPQMTAILGKSALDDEDYAQGVETIMTMVLGQAAAHGRAAHPD